MLRTNSYWSRTHHILLPFVDNGTEGLHSPKKTMIAHRNPDQWTPFKGPQLIPKNQNLCFYSLPLPTKSSGNQANKF